MRHGIAGNKLSRNQSLRKATVRDIAKATLIQQRISTTQAKAKEARKLVDKLITLGKKGTLADKRRAFAILCDHKLVKQLFDETSPRFNARQGGYTRIISYTNRRGDNAKLVFLELTEKKEIIVSKPKAAKAKATSEKSVKVDSPEESQAIAKTAEPKPKKAKAAAKDETKAVDEKGKKGIVGGISKMFNRKQSGK